MKRIGLTLLALAALFFAPAPKDAPIGVQRAEAQSACQYIAYGAVLTAAQWNSCFQSKADAVGAPFLPLAGGTMTGELITAASVTSSAGFNLPPGTAPSSPGNGDLWTTSGGIYARIGGTTYDLLTPSVSLVGGTTPITGTCTTTYFLYNNGGTLGCQAINSTITANSTATSGFGVGTLAYSDGSLIQATGNLTYSTSALSLTSAMALRWNSGDLNLSRLAAAQMMLSDSTTASILTVSQSTDSLTSRTNYGDFSIDTSSVANTTVLGTNRGGTSTWTGQILFKNLGVNSVGIVTSGTGSGVGEVNVYNGASIAATMNGAGQVGVAGNISITDNPASPSTYYGIWRTTYFYLANGIPFGWGASPASAADTGMSRASAAVIDFGNGTQGDVTATLVAAHMTLNSLANTATTSAVCYNTSTGVLTYDGTIGTCNTSDERLKTFDHMPLGDALGKLVTLSESAHFGYFHWNDPAQYGAGERIGAGAQTVASLYPELTDTGSNGYMSLAYDKLTVPIIQSLREIVDSCREAANDNFCQQLLKKVYQR